MYKSILLFCGLVFIFFTCKTEKKDIKLVTDSSSNELNFDHDPHSFSKPEISSIKHLHLIANIDFPARKIVAKARYTLNPGFGKELILDTRGLEIKSVDLLNESSTINTKFKFGESDSILGKALVIDLNPAFSTVEINYNTTDDAAALMWIDKEQTDSKKFPYLFTQSQSIYARTWIPVPDGPGMRFTYSAEINVPKGMMAAMSANNTQNMNPTGNYKFEMNFPIPAYLLALAVGEFSFLPIGDHTGVYASPSLIEKAKNEFEDLEKMLLTAENLYGKYPWGRYDVLVLPPSFPFGGMENPMLTFVTPSVIAGDRSLTSLLAHELAHSWSGNLITNSTWNDFWINEGFTTYFESRIMESLYGKEYADMLSILGYQDLQKTVRSSDSLDPLTKLHMDLEGQDPELSLGDIAYEKGKLFLRMLEEHYGREKFDSFLKAYFDKFKFQSMNASKFEKFLTENLIHNDTKMLDAIKVWIHTPGLPEFKPSYTYAKFNNVETQVNQFLKSKKTSEIDAKNYSTHEWLHLIRTLPQDSQKFIVKTLDNAFQLSNSGNAEIQCAWLEYVIENGDAKQYYKNIEAFLCEKGRRKFLMTLYTALTEQGQIKIAETIFQKAKKSYHPISIESIEELLAKS
jgi:leukotriene-A4 hydrolase